MEQPGVLAAPRSGSKGLLDLFLAFLEISLSGFGGAINWAHRSLVERRRWMTDQDFTETLSFCQFLPGPNIVNFSVCVGQRAHGLSGALSALAGVMAIPFAIFLAFGWLYERYGQMAIVHGALNGVSAAAAGFVIAVSVKLAQPHRHKFWSLVFGTAAFVCVGLLQLPLIDVFFALAIPSVAIAWWSKR